MCCVMTVIVLSGELIRQAAELLMEIVKYCDALCIMQLCIQPHVVCRSQSCDALHNGIRNNDIACHRYLTPLSSHIHVMIISPFARPCRTALKLIGFDINLHLLHTSFMWHAISGSQMSRH